MDGMSWQEMVAFLSGLRDSNNWAMDLFLEAQEAAAKDDDDGAEEEAAKGWERCDKIDDLINDLESQLDRFGLERNYDYQATMKYPAGM